MTESTVASPQAWAPEACTLPTADRPLRVAEFDDLLAGSDLLAQSETTLMLGLPADPETAGTAARLATRETACCGFFTFGLTIGTGSLTLDVTVPAEHRQVVTALADRVRRPDR